MIICEITRTSLFSGQPHPDAVHTRLVRKHNSRTFEDEIYTIKFDSPAAVLEWIKGLDETVVMRRASWAGEGEDLPEWRIEIYDDYRE